MASYTGKDAEIHIIFSNGIKMRCEGAVVDHSIDWSNVTDLPYQTVYEPGVHVVTVRATGGRVEKPRTDAQKLARAVLDNDENTALLLADEVQLAFAARENFVSRTELLKAIKAVADNYYWSRDDETAQLLHGILEKCKKEL